MISEFRPVGSEVRALICGGYYIYNLPVQHRIGGCKRALWQLIILIQMTFSRALIPDNNISSEEMLF